MKQIIIDQQQTIRILAEEIRVVNQKIEILQNKKRLLTEDYESAKSIKKRQLEIFTNN